MSAKGHSDDFLRATVDAYRAANFVAKDAADSIQVNYRTYLSRLKVAAERGMLLDTPAAMPGFRISQVTEGPAGKSIQQKPERGEAFEVPAGHLVKGVSALVDQDGREVLKWVKTKEGVLDPLQVAEWIKAAFADYEPAALPVAAPPSPRDDLLTLIPLADWHLGMFSWHRETSQNWDLKIAERAIGRAIGEVISRSPSSGEAIVLGGGDLLHSDNNDNKTARSGNALQVDGRYQKVVQTACRLVVGTVDAALQRHGRVTVRILPGNHDEHACVAVTWHLAAWYRNEPRVTVDTDPSLYFWRRFGLVMLGATHGHTVKIKNMPQIMAHRRAEDWGATRHRFVHGFHLHHVEKAFSIEGQGVISEIHQSPAPQDAWHFGAGFLSGRSVQTITYHAERGEYARGNQTMFDDQMETQ